MNFARGAGRYVVRTFAGIGVLTAGGVAASQYFIVKEKKKAEDIPSSVVLHLDMNVPLIETNPKPFEGLFNPQPPMKVHSVVKALEHAATDKRVAGVVCTFGGQNSIMNLATWQEVRNAILKFREAQKDEPEGNKKFAWASADTFGEAGDGTVDYYFASAFDKIHMQPTGLLGLMGAHIPVLFYKKLLARLGVEPSVFNYYEYKNATNPFTQEGFTEPHKEQLNKLLVSLFGQVTDGIAEGRALPLDTVKALVDRGSMTAEQAKEAKLIDTVLYPDQVLSHVQEGTKVLPMRKYIKNLESKEKKQTPTMSLKDDKPKIALITMVGPIIRGWGDPNSRSSQICSEKAMREIRTAYQDKTVKAIVVRIDSRGGSAVASDSIRRELARAKEAGLPVVVSMGNFAASGGYYISTAADKIIAQPSTITGSIGVIFGKFVLGKALEQIGVTHDDIKVGEMADSMSPYKHWTKEQAEVANAMGRKVYMDFTQLVMDSRKLSQEEVDKLARGRVWTGADAKTHQLVDELGGLKDAHALAGKLAGLEGKALPALVDFPKPKSPVEKLAAVLSGDSPDATTTTTLLQDTGAGELMGAILALASMADAVKKTGLTGEGDRGVRLEADDLGR